MRNWNSSHGNLGTAGGIRNFNGNQRNLSTSPVSILLRKMCLKSSSHFERNRFAFQ